MEFFDSWRALNARFDEGDLTTLTQLVGYKLLAIFDEHRFPESLPLTDRKLMELTGAKSTRAIMEARRVLKNAGLIDFETSRARPTVYRLTLSQNNPATNLEQERNKIGTSEKNPNIRARDPFTPISSSTSSRACMRDYTELDDAQDYWDDVIRGGKLSIEHLSEIDALINRHGLEWVKSAMREAGDANGNRFGLSMKLFRAVVDKRLNSKPTKGCEKRERPATGYDLSGTESMPEWFVGG